MPRNRSRAFGALFVLVAFVMSGCTGEASPGTSAVPDTAVSSIFFQTTSVTDGGAGLLYNQPLMFGATGDATLPDRFDLSSGNLPLGVQLLPVLDAEGNSTGTAQLLGFPRATGNFSFSVKAIATDNDPALAATQSYQMTIDQGSVAVITPNNNVTTDVDVPAFPFEIDFVNPADGDSFFSFAFQVAGGTTDKDLNVYIPRDLELSNFDVSVVAGGPVSADTDESDNPGINSRYDTDSSDGGWFVAAGAHRSVQVGGFQSPRGTFGAVTIDPDNEWFQPDTVPQDSRRFVGDTVHSPADGELLKDLKPGTSILFSDYFSDEYIATKEGLTSQAPRRKYPFRKGQYENAFNPPPPGSPTETPLQYLIIVEAIDKRGTPGKVDFIDNNNNGTFEPAVDTFLDSDRIDRKAFVARVKVPDIRIDTVFLPNGQAGVDYTGSVAASGGVPPLVKELAHVDTNANFHFLDNGSADITPVTKTIMGLGIDTDSGRFIGVPRVAAPVNGPDIIELTVRVSADKLSTLQGASALASNPSDGERQGTISNAVATQLGFDPQPGDPLVGGIWRTYRVNMALPTPLSILNGSLRPGTDGI